LSNGSGDVNGAQRARLLSGLWRKYGYEQVQEICLGNSLERQIPPAPLCRRGVRAGSSGSSLFQRGARGDFFPVPPYEYVTVCEKWTT
jgi:hypothetical protein